jgi:lipid-binding SYLF domain-containing protein
MSFSNEKLEILFVALLLILTSAGTLSAADENAKRLEDAAIVLNEIMETPDQSIPQDLLDRAQCIVIVPGMKKGAFIFGAKYGKGYIFCRKKSGSGWSGPGTVRIEGGSFGFQIGLSETDLVMLVMNQGGVDRLLSSQFTLGADASVAAGPVGRATNAQTDALLSAQILSWSRSHGIFAGISLQGATLRQDLTDNRNLYGRTLENKEIIEKELPVPAPAKDLIALLDRFSPKKK